MHLIPGIHDINTEFLTSVLVVHLSVQFKKKKLSWLPEATGVYFKWPLKAFTKCC